jgi:hypothetical protein
MTSQTSEVRLQRRNLACSAKYGGQGVHVLFSEIKIKIQVRKAVQTESNLMLFFLPWFMTFHSISLSLLH